MQSIHCNPYTYAQVAQTGDEADIQAEDFEDGSDQDSDNAMDDLGYCWWFR